MPNSSLESLPAYLRRYCAIQDYSKYTTRDHAAWRYIMRQSREYFRDHAVPIYVDGLHKTGITIDRIPKVTDMDAALREFGWGAVPVCGFIPPIAFLDLQARGILPIATDMRSIDHIAYTPAPDIVHEAAGHAPIIADKSYRSYLRKYASMANKTIMSVEDLALYEAIRVLSDIKENPDSKPGEIERSQKELDRAVRNVSYLSEATKVSRMAWWTVEYGLVGPLKSPKIYGAGLLSSVGESQACLSNQVRKIPLTVKCVDTSYDITEPQPQLFVAEDMDQLTEVLHDLEETLSFKIGGIHGLEQARKAKTVNTVQLDTGLQISGVLVAYEAAMHGERGDSHFFKFAGPTQICIGERQMSGQGRVRHPTGFSSPIGRWTAARHKSPSNLTDSELLSLGVRKGHKASIEFMNGFRVEGVVQNIVRDGQKILYITWIDCRVSRGAQSYFEPTWGEFDMPVAEAVTSVFGGPADREAFGEYEMGGVSTQPGRTSPFTHEEIRIFDCYAKIRDLRLSQSRDKSSSFIDIAERMTIEHPKEWLLALEVLEQTKQAPTLKALETKVFEMLIARADQSEGTTAELINKGIRIAGVSD